jgi:predicted RNase H-like HicB family nuclease
LPGANTQGETLDEARENLKEAVELVLEANRILAEEPINPACRRGTIRQVRLS